jgi:hypothetical protein
MQSPLFKTTIKLHNRISMRGKKHCRRSRKVTYARIAIKDIYVIWAQPIKGFPIIFW